ncbi:MAG: DUF7674 family protein [Lysobacteraceae bacterium]
MHERQFIALLRQGFGTEAAATDQWLIERGWEQDFLEESPHTWLEAFAEQTNDAIARRDSATVIRHTEYMARGYLQGGDEVKRLIDVGYAEHLLWRSDAAEKVWAWPHIAAPVRALYEQMWGAPAADDPSRLLHASPGAGTR